MRKILPVISLLVFLLASSVESTWSQNAADLSASSIEKEVLAAPDNHALRIIAGFHYFDRGEFARAIEHFKKASEITPEDAYDRAWLFMAQLRNDPTTSDKPLRDFLAKHATKEFIVTDIKALLGDLSPEKGVELATLSKEPGNLCEIHYYAAQRLFAEGKKEEARRHLREALKPETIEYWEYKSASSILNNP